MFVNFFLFLKHVFNIEGSQSTENSWNPINYYHSMDNQELCINQCATRFLKYFNEKDKTDFKDSSINSFIIYFFLFPKGDKLENYLSDLLSNTYHSFRNYMIAESYQSNDNMWIKENNTLCIKIQDGLLEALRAGFQWYNNNQNIRMGVLLDMNRKISPIYQHGELVIYVGRKKFDLETITPEEFAKSCIFIGTNSKIKHHIKILDNNESSIYVFVPVATFIVSILLTIYYYYLN